MNKPRTLGGFKQAHDPMFKGDSPVAYWEWPKGASGARRFIFTAAQNATPVHPGFWDVLTGMSAQLHAPLMVIPFRYKNPTSQWNGSKEGASHWVEEVRPHLMNSRHALNENFVVLGDIKIQPTASDPLTGFESYAQAMSAVVGHPKIQTRSIATPSNKMAKLLMTSGACTVQNYSDTRVGRVGEFHHSLSAVLVELDGKRFYARRLHYDTKTNSVTDLGTTYYADGRERAAPALALVMGDLHVDFADPAVVRATFGKGGIADLVRPQHLVYHDLLDGYSVNHHHGKNPFNKLAKSMHRDGYSARGEVNRAIQFLRDTRRKDARSIVVASNHDDFLKRWVVETDWRDHPVNAEFYLETALAMVQGTKLTTKGTEYPSPFPYWLRKAELEGVTALDSDESFTLADVELAMHGDHGPNGSRGSIRNLRRLGVKSMFGHSHSPGEDEGAMQVGTSTRLRLEYNTGPSSWLNAHGVLLANGKRQLVVIVDGRYRPTA